MAVEVVVPATGLDSLVDDVLIQILSILPVWDLLNIRRTSKRFEALTHVLNVWHNIFVREVIKCGRPIPGYSFFPTPRLLQLFSPSADCICEPSRDIVEASDLEARTLHALRLDKHWKSSLNQPGFTELESFQHTHQLVTPASNVYLLPGGRFVITTHQDRTLCWDLGFPRSSEQRRSQDGRLKVRCVGDWVFPRALVGQKYTARLETCLHMDWRTDCAVHLALCEDAIESDSRSCIVLSVRSDPLHASGLPLQATLPIDESGSPFASPVPFFNKVGSFILPSTLPQPRYPSPVKEGDPESPTSGPYGPQRFVNGKLGKLLHVSESYLFFSSLVPREDDVLLYCGIEVLDWRSSDPGSQSVLLEYPDPQVGPYVGIYVLEPSSRVLVVWESCVGLYSLPQPLSSPSDSSRTGCSSVTGIPSGRIVIMPIIVFALSELVEAPISFSACQQQELDRSFSSDSNGLVNEIPHPLTIIARSKRQPHLSVQSVLTCSPTSSHQQSVSGEKLAFRLSRVPTHSHYRHPSELAGEKLEALAIGASGRGVRMNASGELYRCGRTDIVLPRFVGLGFMDCGSNIGGTVPTIDSWSSRRAAALSIPSWKQNGDDSKLLLQFDEGMGRAVAAYQSSGSTSELSIIDFA